MFDIVRIIPEMNCFITYIIFIAYHMFIPVFLYYYIDAAIW